MSVVLLFRRDEDEDRAVELRILVDHALRQLLSNTPVAGVDGVNRAIWDAQPFSDVTNTAMFLKVAVPVASGIHKSLCKTRYG